MIKLISNCRAMFRNSFITQRFLAAVQSSAPRPCSAGPKTNLLEVVFMLLIRHRYHGQVQSNPPFYLGKLLTLFTILVAAQIGFCSDIRLVGNARVDLEPVHEWIKSKSKTNRPLPHWKNIQIITIEPFGSFKKCEIKFDGEQKAVLLNHIPPQTLKHFSELTRLKTRKRELEVFISEETVRLRGQHIIASHADFDSPLHIQYQRDEANLANREDELANVTEELEALMEQNSLLRELAMFTGANYAKLEIWDCGIKQSE